MEVIMNNMEVIMKLNARRLVLAGLLAGSWLPADLSAQTPGQHLVLVRAAEGFVLGNADGTLGTSAFAVPAGQELCVTDIGWSASGDPGAHAVVGAANLNVGGTAWRMFTENVILDNQGRGSGDISFKSGPKLVTNGGISAIGAGVTGLAMTVYGLLRPISAVGCG
jgi:hypothetical protein